jgi:hypothetical protein
MLETVEFDILVAGKSTDEVSQPHRAYEVSTEDLWHTWPRVLPEAFDVWVEMGRRDMLEFAITFKADMSPAHMVNLTVRQKRPVSPMVGPSIPISSGRTLPIVDAHGGQHRTYAPRDVCTNPVVRSTVTASLLATLNRLSGGRWTWASARR